MKQQLKISLICLLLFSVSMFSQDEIEEKNPTLTKKFEIEAGVFNFQKNLKLGGNLDLPDEGIEFDKAFDLDDYQSTFFLNASWRFSEKWILTGEYLAISSSNSATLNEDIIWDNGEDEYVFEQGSYVKGGTDLKLYRIFVGRIISQGQKHEFSAGLGFHILDFSVSLEGKAKINGNEIGDAISSSSVLVPLPNIAIWYKYALSKRWSLQARTDWFGIKIGEVSGLLWDLEPKVSFEITENFGLSTSYRYFSLGANVDNNNWNGNFDMSFKGPTLSLHGRF